MALSQNINWNLLHTFVVIAENQSLSRASKILGRGQPAVSAALKNLEDQLGVPLAERSSHTFRLTSSGRLLYREAVEICGSIDRITMFLAETEETLTGNLRITTASQMTSPVIDAALSHFHRMHPKATLSSTVMNGPELILSLSNKIIHFGICPAATKRDDFDYFHLFKEYCAFYCGPSHPLFGKKGLKIDDLRGHTAIAYQTAVLSDSLKSITDLSEEVGFASPFVGVANTLDELRRMVVSGLGIGAIPVQIAARDVRDGRLWPLPPFEDVMPIDVYLITNTKVRPSATEQSFLSIMREEVNKLPESERIFSSANVAGFIP
ncbi:LysR family transcriptional regulator [Roseovarius pelagicus]|uniref:LysR family transcriptional regulator n=1 Tax=Roseovarius pelagicus TaxID=2980108 RepID=A0ABY6D6M9_9RHOB|nr:LysR family transcriptional regulator [Roseovarius pelagicus]UXX81758.1 LysR family transcriptional regulator [Roseovarius pelagicus]